PGNINPQFCALAQFGFTIISPNYRRSSINTDFGDLLEGNEDRFPGEDLKATLKFVKNNPEFESDKILLTGISYGTYLNLINLHQISDQLAGVHLHTGFFGNPSPSPFDNMNKIDPDLPIFIASGGKDKGNTGR